MLKRVDPCPEYDIVFEYLNKRSRRSYPKFIETPEYLAKKKSHEEAYEILDTMYENGELKSWQVLEIGKKIRVNNIFLTKEKLEKMIGWYLIPENIGG